MKNENELRRETPIVIFIASEPSRMTVRREALEARGWKVCIAENGAQACAIAAAEQPHLMVLDFGDWLSDVQSTVRALRMLEGPVSAMPVIGLWGSAMAENDPDWSRVDTVIDAPVSAEGLAQALEPWRPVSLDATRRIAAILGAGPIAGMIERLARRLEASLPLLERGTIDKAEAHRLAGLCGTLGFAQAHAAWLDLSVNSESGLGEVRRTTRLTLAAIARGL